jgi:hypothetical protein
MIFSPKWIPFRLIMHEHDPENGNHSSDAIMLDSLLAVGTVVTRS